MTDKKILKAVVIEPGYSSYDLEHNILKEFIGNLHVVPEDTSYDEKIAAVKDADALLVREAIVDHDLIEQMEKCRVVVRYGVGVDNIDLEAAKARKIFVANVPQYGAAHEVSCHAVAMVLAVSRLIIQ